MNNSDKIILSLFDHSGVWSDPYKRAGYTVLKHDIKDGWDILERFPYPYRLEKAYGILAAPPCTDFTNSGARWWVDKDKPGTATCECCETTTEHSMLLVYATLHLVDLLKPEFWALENPIGRINKLVPELGKPKLIFNPTEFGELYTKKTAIYGDFNSNLKTDLMLPLEGSKMWSNYGGKSERTKELRSITPKGFAKAFFEANR